MSVWLLLVILVLPISLGLIGGVFLNASETPRLPSIRTLSPAVTRTAVLTTPLIALLVAVVSAFTATPRPEGGSIPKAFVGAPRQNTVTLPIEATGPDGYTKSVTVTASDVARVDSLYLRAYSIGYPYWEGYDVSKASIRINGGPWTELNDTIATCKYPESAFDCIDGPYHTIRFEVAISDVGGSLVDGSNTLDFRFHYAFPEDSPDDFGDPSTGYRILGLELRRADDSDAIDGTSFTWDDPATWTAPEGYDDPESIAHGKVLWNQRNLLTPRWDVDDTITAACGDCHASDGRDLAYFAFSNRSIIARSEFHGLTESQGKKIAAYIRSYTLEDPDTGQTYDPPGRPWHPVYQPGPTSVASRSENAPRTAGTRISDMPGGGSQFAAAGAGVEWALDHDREMLPYVFPGGPSPDDFEIDAARDGLHVPAPIQFPDWNEWLPVHHPLDMWGEEIKTWGDWRSGFWDPVEGPAGGTHRSFSDYRECASTTAPGNPDCLKDLWWATRLLSAETDHFEDAESELVQPGYTDVTTQSDEAYRHVNLEKWATVKLWDVISTYDAGDEFANLETHHGGTWANSDWYTWPGGFFPFDLAPHLTGTYAGNKHRAYDLWLDNAWYELAVRVNSGRGHKLGNRPVDWQYQNTHLDDLGNLGIDQPLRRVFTYMKSLEVCESFDSTLDARKHNPRSWAINRYICGPILGVSHELFRQLDTYQSGLHRAAFEILFEEQVEAMMYRHSPDLGENIDASWDRLRNDRGGWEPKDTPIHTDAVLDASFWHDPGGEPSQFYHVLALGEEIGVRSSLLDSAAVWLDGMTPSNEWDVFRWTPESVPVQIRRTFGDASGTEDFGLVALPGQVDRPLEETLSGEAGTAWQAYWDDGSSRNALRKFDDSDTFHLRPGRGFWLTSTDDWTVSGAIPTVDLRGDTAAVIDLHDGWNIIANPLDKSVPWSAVEGAAGASLDPLWRFDGSFVQADTFASAKAGEAFYFLNDRDLDSVIVPYPYPEGPITKGARPGGSSGDLLALSARPDGEIAPTSTVRVGIAENAEEGFGPLDVTAPPRRFSTLSLRLAAGGEASARRRFLAEEVRPSGGEGYTFDLHLRSKGRVPVRIDLQNVDAIRGRAVVLLRPQTGQSYDLRRTSTVVLQEVDSTRLQLAVGTEDYVEKTQEHVVPEEVTLTSYPNPVRRQATLAYTLPESQAVRLVVYDTLGREVAVLTDGEKRAGRHRVRFEARRLSSGLYFGRLQAADKALTRRIIVVR